MGHVLAGAAVADGMALGLQRLDDLRRPQAQRLPHPTVVAAVALVVVGGTASADLDLRHRPLRHPAVGHVQLLDPAVLLVREVPGGGAQLGDLEATVQQAVGVGHVGGVVDPGDGVHVTFERGDLRGQRLGQVRLGVAQQIVGAPECADEVHLVPVGFVETAGGATQRWCGHRVLGSVAVSAA